VLSAVTQCRTSRGISYDFSLDRGSDYLRRRRDLFLGHRKLRQRPSFGKSSQTARGANLLGGDPSAGVAVGGNLLVMAIAHSDARDLDWQRRAGSPQQKNPGIYAGVEVRQYNGGKCYSR